MLNGTVSYEPALDALTVAPPAEVDPLLAAVLHDMCAALWRRGWQPVELHRIVARRNLPTHAHLVTDAVAWHLRRFPRPSVDQRWLAQVDSLGADVWWTGPETYLTELTTRWKVDRVAVIDVVLTLLVTLSRLPPIEVLIPPPGTFPLSGAVPPGGEQPGVDESGSRRQIDARLLGRVRGLLAKAESTTYAAEAEAYTTKAQEIITRHSLNEALLVAQGAVTAVVPFARRIGVDHPHADEKASLLNVVARANRCHVVWSPELGFATVFGFDADLDAVDLLHTSLLVQAHRAMARTEPAGGRSGRAQLRTFRQSFLVAFGVRIGERLAIAAQAAVAEAIRAAHAADAAHAAGAAHAADAAHATRDPARTPPALRVADRTGTASPADLLPVLASRDEEVRETMRSVFPRTVRSRGTRIGSRDGWDSGRAAADRAALHTREAAHSS